VLHALASAGFSAEHIKTLNCLEIGCGECLVGWSGGAWRHLLTLPGVGAVTHHLAALFSTVHCIDISPSMLLAFSEQHPSSSSSASRISHSLHLLAPDSRSTFASGRPLLSPTNQEPERRATVPRAQFDVAVANLVLHHVDNFDGLFGGLLEVLSPGGWFVCTEFGRVEGQEDVAAQFRESKAAMGGGHPHQGDATAADDAAAPPDTRTVLTEGKVSRGLPMPAQR
jgi:SAM-dependent methyltransferase